MRGSRGEVDKIIGTGHFRLPCDLHRGFSFQDKESLFQVRMDMGVGLTSVLNLTQDNFQAIRAAGSRTEETVICRLGMARRRVGKKVFHMGDIFFHSEFLPCPLICLDYLDNSPVSIIPNCPMAKITPVSFTSFFIETP
jgi:hypothetical protein